MKDFYRVAKLPLEQRLGRDIFLMRAWTSREVICDMTSFSRPDSKWLFRAWKGLLF